MSLDVWYFCDGCDGCCYGWCIWCICRVLVIFNRKDFSEIVEDGDDKEVCYIFGENVWIKLIE